MRKSATNTAALSSRGAVRTLRILPVTSMCAPRCMWRIIATAMATHRIPIPEAIKIFFDMSDLVHDAQYLFHGSVRRLDQRSIEEMRLQADLIRISIAHQRRHDALPVFLFGARRHHALALHLNVQDAF